MTKIMVDQLEKATQLVSYVQVGYASLLDAPTEKYITRSEQFVDKENGDPAPTSPYIPL